MGRQSVGCEQERVEAVRNLQLLDIAPDESFERITRHCAEVFETSFAFISLIEENRQWFLSAYGFDIRETMREDTFCGHIMTLGASLCIPDALADERFATNPFVTGAANVRAYLGVPIKDPEGHLLGTLCVIDQRPRDFTKHDHERLALLAGTVEDLIQAHYQRNLTARLNENLWQEAVSLKKANSLLKQAEQLGRIGAWEIDLTKGTMLFSDEMYALSGISNNEPINIERALLFYPEDDRPRISSLVQRAADDGTPFNYEADLLTGDGQVKHIRCTGERFECEEGCPARVVGVVQDITEAYQAHLALQRAADYDALTGVFNRHAFDRKLQEKIREQRHTSKSLSLILLDLDGFKDINDCFGHVVGDVVLEEVSSRLIKAVPSGATLARWGGDEFAIVPPLGASHTDVTDMAHAILSSIGRSVDLPNRKIQLSGTCGIAPFEKGIGAKELLRRADLALYHGKNRERSSVHQYSLEMESTNQARQIAMANVRSALDERRLFAGYQPIIEIASEEIVGMEALMRLQIPSGQKLTATEVLPALLDPLLSREIAERMFQFVCADQKQLRGAHANLRSVSVNVTEADLLSREFATRILPLIKQADLKPNAITIEITETMLLVNDNSTVLRVLTELHDAGVSIALDDFGTGFSSLSHLRDFPIDMVKVDKSFVQSMAEDWQARTIVQALIAMAKNMGIAVVAEGVETEEQLDLLRNMGCEMAQGFLFSPALDIGRVTLASFSNRNAIEASGRRVA